MTTDERRLGTCIIVRAVGTSPLLAHGCERLHVASKRARIVLATAIEGVFARNATPTSLLAALYSARCGDPLVPFTAAEDPGPERRFVGGA